MPDILPFFPLVRGLSLSFCYERVKTGIRELKNSKGITTFADPDRVIAKEFLDQRQIVREKFPIAILKTRRISTKNIQSRADSIPHWEKSAIAHTGTGTEAVELVSKTFWGNNRYRIKITVAGTVGANGTGKYRLYKTPYTAAGWGSETEGAETLIPANGEITIGDGTKFKITVGQSVIANDIYSWSVFAFKVANLIVRDIVIPITAEIYCENEKEFTESGGIIDQALCFFGEKLPCQTLSTGEVQIVDEEITGIEVQPVTRQEETETVLVGYQINLNLQYHGMVFKAIVAPLTRVMVTEEPVLTPKE